MSDTTTPKNPGTRFTCAVHGVQSGSECPICRHFSAPPEVEAEVEPGFDLRLHAAEFWRSYGKLALAATALATVVSFFPYTATRPLGYDPTPHRQAITELETVLFYEGATDTTEHPQMVGSLLDALLASLEKDSATFKRAELITAFKEMRDQVRVQAPGTYRLAATRQRWLTLRVSNFDAAPWFRENSVVLDQLQSKTQGAQGSATASQVAADEANPVPRSAPAPPPSALALLGILDEYERAVERFVARAGNLTMQACDAGGGDGSYSNQLYSLSNDTAGELTRIIGDDVTARNRLASVASYGQAIIRRRGIECRGSGPPSQIFARELATFQQAAKATRRSIEENPPTS